MAILGALAGLLFAAAVLIALFAVIFYNRMVRMRNMVRASWADIDVQLKKRHDLVPNLHETVRGYAAHEKSIFEKVSEARSAAMGASVPADRAKAENALAGTLRSLFAVAEAYPELKANANFMQLQSQLQELENNIESARRYYNAVVRDLNTVVESFPSNLVASSFGFAQAEFFELESPDVERQPVKVSFS